MRAGYGGIVYIEEEYAYGGEPPIYGSWQKDDWFEEGPGWATAAAAIAWGRHRAPYVYLRVDLEIHTWRRAWVDGMLVRLPAPGELRSVHYSAGEIHRQDEDDPVFLRWPGSSDRREDVVADGYGYAVWLVQAHDVWNRGEPVGYTARWEAEREGVLWPKEIVGPAWGEALDEAIAWARERAPYVLVHHHGAGYESAGVRQFEGLGIPRIDEYYEAEATPLPEGPFHAAIWVGESWTPKSFPIPEGLEPAGGLPVP